jgi:hypothetical protein
LICLTGCVNFKLGNKVVAGSGNVVTQEVSLEKPLSGVRTMGAIDVVFDPDLNEGILLEGEDNILELVEVKQNDDGVLEFGFYPNISITSIIKVNAYVPCINGGLIETTSVGSIRAEGSGKLEGDRFEIKLSSTGSVELTIQAQEIKVDSSSTGTITLDGSSDQADITLSSTGNFEGYDFFIGDAAIFVSSSGSAYVNVSGALEATISGPGNVLYTGDPTEVTVKGGGPGTVKPR